MVPYKCCFSARSQGGVKIGHGGPLLQKTSSSDLKDTATNRMHSNDLEACAKKMFLFLVPFRSQIFDLFFMSFWTLVILVSTGAKGKNGVINVRGKSREKICYRSKIVVISCTYMYISSTCLSKFLFMSVGENAQNTLADGACRLTSFTNRTKMEAM